MKKSQDGSELSRNRYIAPVLLFAAACIVSFVLITYWNMRDIEMAARTNDRALHSLRVLERVLDDMQDLETGQRGFIITKRKDFLEPFYRSLPKLETDSADLKSLSSADPAKSQRIDRLVALIQSGVKLNKWLVRFKSSPDYDQVTAIEQSAKCKLVMDGVRALILSLETDDRAVLNKSNTDWQKRAEQINKLFIMLSVIFFLALFINFYVVRKSLKRQSNYQDRLKRLSSIVEQTSEAVISTDLHTNVQSWNRGAENVYGYTPDEVIGQPILSILKTLVTEDERTVIQRRLDQDQAYRGEFYQFTKDGRPLVILSSISASKNLKGELTGWIVISRDITERKMLEEQVTYLAGLVENTSDSILSTDVGLRVKSWNKAAVEMYGYTQDEAIGQSLIDLIKSPLSAPERERFLSDLKEKGYYRHEFEYKRKSGEPIYVFASVTVLKDKGGAITGYVAVHRDVTERKSLEKQLQQLNAGLEEKVKIKTAELTNIVERITDAFVALDADWTYTYLNKKAGEIFRLDPQSLVGKNIWSEFPAGIGSKFYHAYHTAMQTQRYMQVQEYYKMPGIWLEYNIYPSPDGLSVFFRDITESKEAEEQIARERDLSGNIINTLPGLFYLYNTEGKFLRWNKNFEIFSGYSADEIQGMHPVDFFADDEKELLKEKIANVFKVGEDSVEANLFTKAQQKIPFYFTGLLTRFNNELCLMGSAIDITGRKKIEKDLKESNGQLRELATHLQDIREEERTSMAREIHDELGQQLTGLKMDISWLSKKLAGHDEKVSAKIQGSMQLIDITINTVRKLAADLRPSILDDLGLVEALQWQSREFADRTGINVKTVLPDAGHRFSPDIITGIFRIFQESLTNVARHAKATEVECSLVIADNNLSLRVSDNGEGFEAGATGNRKTLGLLGMKERILMLNGKYEITSQPGKGTTVSADVPLD